MKNLNTTLRNNTSLKAVLTIILTLTFAMSIVPLPAANAHLPAWGIPTFAYVVAIPNPVGVGQTMYVYMFLGNPPYPEAALENDYRYHNYILTITAPDGKIQTKTFEYISDPTNSQYYRFTPTQVGTYTFNFTYPGQAVNTYSHLSTSAYTNDTFLPSSNTATLTVQQEPIPTTVDPLPPITPAEYWTRPIYGENINWWSISSNWLGTGVRGYGSMPGPNEGMFSGDAVGPQTGHVVWTKPLQFGGVVGGNNFAIQGDTWFEGSAYNQRFTNPIVVNGRLYYTETVSFTGVTSGPTTCVDLRTGQVIWSRNDVPALSFAYIYSLHDPQQHGVYPAILFTSNFARAFDANTGNQLFNVTGVPSGTSVLGPQGEHLRYVMANAGNTSSPDWRLGEWNSTRMWSGMGFPGNLTTGLSPVIQNSSTGASWSMIGSTMTNNFIVDASISTGAYNRYDWNISIPWRNTITSTPSILSVFAGNLLLLRNGSYPALGPGAYVPYTYFAVNLNKSKGPVGSVLWWNTVNPPAGKNITTITYAGADPTAGVFTESYRQTSQFVGYSLTTGQQIWGPTVPQAALDYYGSPGPGTLANQIAYGNIYSSAYSGILYCYDLKTGNLLWTYGNGGKGNSTNSNFEVPGPYPILVNAVGNGVVYLISSEHTIQTPIYQGAVLRAVNATTGQELWTLSNINNEFATSSFAIADGFAATFNGYDNQIYSIGRGPSSTSITASPKVSTFGDNILIEGTVMDISAGTKQNEQAARFSGGVPAVSDASMKDWMGYVYQQKSRPTNTIGVGVVLSVLDSNGNTYNIGNATTDSSGAFSLMWQPPISGKYTIFATFAGTNGYWPSFAEAAVGVSEAPQATPASTATTTLAPTPTPTATPTSTATPTPTTSPSPAPNPTGGFAIETYVAVAAVVVIALIAATAIVLKRRK